MLAEWLTYLTTPCPRPLRRLGYPSEIIGTWSRHRRCRAAWAPHLENCRKAIGAAALAAPSHRKATVLGSGLLLDVPLDALAAMFGEVVLVDILHLPAVRRSVARFRNARLVEADLSGVVGKLTGMSDGDPSLDLPDGDADLVVSANLLTQLPFLPCRWLKRHRAVAEDAIEAFEKAILRHHLQALARLPGRVCLITEIEQRLCEGDTPVDTYDPLHGLDVGAASAEWTWDIAPRPELHRRYDLRYRVVATAGPQGLPRNSTRAAP